MPFISKVPATDWGLGGFSGGRKALSSWVELCLWYVLANGIHRQLRLHFRHLYFLCETTVQCFLILLWQAPLGVCSAKRSLQSERFWATSIASFRDRLSDFRSCWIVFFHVVWGRPSGLLQFSKAEAIEIFLASVSSGIHAVWPVLTGL